MSVVAWDGKTLAGDRQVTIEDVKGLCCKIHEAKDGTLVGTAGNNGACAKVVQWVMGGMRDNARPTFDKNNDADAIIVKPDGTAWYLSDFDCTLEPLPRKQWAIGSGAGLAMGAMAMGATAERAVEVASALNINCGGGVDTLRPSKSRGKRNGR